MFTHRSSIQSRGSFASRPNRCVALLATIVAAAAFATTGPARAEPAIDRIEPGGGSRGSELAITLTGKELADPEQLWFENGSIAVVSLAAVDATHAKAVVRIPENSPLGAHRLRLRTKHGLSELRTFRVGNLPQTAER